jgi:hypothetical protein
MKKYELLQDDSITVNTTTLYRIKALRHFGFIKKGDLGGYLQYASNLSHDNTCWVAGDAKVYGYAKVSGKAQVHDQACVFGEAKVFEDALVYGNAQICGRPQVFGNAKIHGYAKVYGQTQVYGQAQIFGKTRICKKAQVCGNAIIYGNAEICGEAYISTFKLSTGTWTFSMDDLVQTLLDNPSIAPMLLGTPAEQFAKDILSQQGPTTS